MSEQLEASASALSDELRKAMRHMAGGVSVITAGSGEDITGLTAITARSLSIDPPKMLICVRSTASAWPVIRRNRHFAVNILAAHQTDVAERFSGVGGVKGPARYADAEWTLLASGALGLRCALAVIDCEVEEVFERHGSGIIIGDVLSATLGEAPTTDPLVYCHGGFAPLCLNGLSVKAMAAS